MICSPSQFDLISQLVFGPCQLGKLYFFTSDLQMDSLLIISHKLPVTNSTVEYLQLQVEDQAIGYLRIQGHHMNILQSKHMVSIF